MLEHMKSVCLYGNVVIWALHVLHFVGHMWNPYGNAVIWVLYVLLIVGHVTPIWEYCHMGFLYPTYRPIYLDMWDPYGNVVIGVSYILHVLLLVGISDIDSYMKYRNHKRPICCTRDFLTRRQIDRDIADIK